MVRSQRSCCEKTERYSRNSSRHPYLSKYISGHCSQHWLATHQHLAAQVSDGRATVVAGADHDIFRSKRQAILDAVDEISNRI